MSGPREKLQQIFSDQNRYSNFGDVLVYLKIAGFRCHESTVIEFESPITAFCGFNGTGKSTIIQLAAVGYRHPEGETSRYYIKDFIISGTLDPSPYTAGAYVEYGYWQNDRKTRKLVVARSSSTKRKGWTGYRGQPPRTVRFAGVGLYLPRIEQRDFVVQSAAKIQVQSTSPIPDESKHWAERILSCSYAHMQANTVKLADRSREVVTVSRASRNYSEANMGCGEGRVQHLIHILETLPEKSLVLIEEPETSLHQRAQYELGLYLMDVCIRRKHQILMTTHSESLLAGLPAVSRVYIDQTTAPSRLIKGVSASQAVSLMSAGHTKALTVLVEDDIAQSILTELIRKRDPQFLQTIAIQSVGDRDTLQTIGRSLGSLGIPLVVVRDGDIGANPSEGIFSLPGTQPPEHEVFGSEQVGRLLQSEYGIVIEDFRASLHGIGHHDWFKRLATQVSVSYDALVQQCAKAYISGLSENELDRLVNQLKASLKK